MSLKQNFRNIMQKALITTKIMKKKITFLNKNIKLHNWKTFISAIYYNKQIQHITILRSFNRIILRITIKHNIKHVILTNIKVKYPHQHLFLITNFIMHV